MKWGDFFLKTFKKKLESGSILKYHCFYFEEGNDLTLTYKRYIDDPVTLTQRLVDKRLTKVNKEKRNLRKYWPKMQKLDLALKIALHLKYLRVISTTFQDIMKK